MASLFTAPQFDGGNGIQPEDGLQLFFFEEGTNTPKDTFTTEALDDANSNPVISLANGVFPEIWMAEGDRYKVRLEDKNDNLAGFGVVEVYIAALSTADFATNPATVSALSALFAEIGDTASTRGYDAEGDGGNADYLAVTKFSEDGFGDHPSDNPLVSWKLQKPNGEVISAQYGALPGGIDRTLPLVAAVAAAVGGSFFVVAGTVLSDSITVPSNIVIRGVPGESVIKTNAGQDNHALIVSSTTNVTIKDLVVDQNRANNTGGHGIRVQDSSDLTLSRLTILETAGYGLGFQGAGTFDNISIDQILIDGTDNDGIDFKNIDDTNENIRISNVVVKNYGTLTGKSGIDVRGPALISNVYVEITENDSVGVKFRVDDGGGTGIGGRESSISNLRVVHTSGTGTGGVTCNNTNINLNNIIVEGTFAGFVDFVGGCQYNNCIALNCGGDGFTVSGDGSSYSNITADNCATGIDVAGDKNTFTNFKSLNNSSNDLRTQLGADNNKFHVGEITGAVSKQGDGNVFKDIIGYVTHTVLESSDIAIDSDGSKVFVVAHGLNIVPDKKSVQLTMLIGTSVTDFAVRFLRVETTDATNVTCRLYLDVASATGGAVCTIGITIT